MEKYLFIGIIVCIIVFMMLLTACVSYIPSEKIKEGKKPQEKEQHPNETISIVFTGDVMIGRLMNDVIAEKGYIWIWGDILSELENADLRIINLETTLTTQKEKWTPKVFNYKSNPENVQALKMALIDYASLANNHILDYRYSGLTETIKVLDDAGIKHAGAGKTLEQAKKPAILEVRGKRIGIISITDNEPGWKANGKPGTNYIRINDAGLEEIKQQISNVRSKVDILIVSAHWGPNMKLRPSREFQDFARSVIDTGADIFHGHSSHVFQGIEIYNNRPILYDTGDFIDDYAVDPVLRNDWSFIFKVRYPREIVLIPIITTFQTRKAKGSEKEDIEKRMIQLSDELGTSVEVTEEGLVIKLR